MFSRHSIVIAALTLAGLGSCGLGSSESHSIVVDRQVLLNTVEGGTHSITRMPDGGFVVAGEKGAGWVNGTDPTGNLVWTYTETLDPRAKTSFQSSFRSAVPMANGKVLVCGSITNPEQTGILVILDRSGKLVQRRLGFSKDKETFPESGFIHCLRWNDGFALIGWSGKGLAGSPRIAKLNADGAIEWEKQFIGLPTDDVVETMDHSLVFATFNSRTFEAELAKVNLTGDVIAKNSIKGSKFLLLHPADLTPTTKIVTYGTFTNITLHTLNERLVETGKPLDIGSFDATQGRGLVLSDGSVALFGRASAPAVAWIGASGRSLALQEIDQTYKSYGLGDAVQVTRNQFVAVQDSVSQNHGLVMTWLSFN
jgi:hypothetical protein